MNGEIIVEEIANEEMSEVTTVAARMVETNSGGTQERGESNESEHTCGTCGV